MHPICYFRTDNIDVTGPFPAPRWINSYLDAEKRVDTAKHAELDEIEANLRILTSGKRLKLKDRRSRLHHDVKAAFRRAQEQGFSEAKRAAFIGPLTISQQNGHPF